VTADRSTTLGVSVVLPCYNEESSVGLCVREALETMRAAGIPGEVVVVDNNSTDDSAAVATAAGARVVPEANPGYGSALRAGFRAARCDIIVMADADFTYDLGKIPELIAPIVRGDADLVLGNRLDEATRQTMPLLHRYVGTPVITFLAARACGRRVVGDSQSGFRAFRRDCLERLGLGSTGMELATEMLIRAARAGLRITEIHTGYRARIGESKLSTFADGWRHLQLILLLAPDLLLIGPGLALFTFGVLLQIFSFVAPAGVEIGSLRWQPVFFSAITLVLGLQALLAGAVLAYHSSVAAPGVHRRFAFVGRPSFTNGCMAVGLMSVIIGLAIDLVLFVVWVNGDSSPASRAVNSASLAQSLIICGSTLATFGIVSRFTRARVVPERADRARGRVPSPREAEEAAPAR
jgi:glycosyltransferase involved in cell wall biosynthesis